MPSAKLKIMAVDKIKLKNGAIIPAIGLGLWKVKDEITFDQMFKAAIEAGYRHFDDAQAYGNEQYLGNCWRKYGLKRDELFITTKILTQNFGYKATLKSFNESLTKLQTDYVDLLLIHFPGPYWLRKEKWRAMEEIKKSGRAKSIGVSNHYVKHLKELEAFATEMPVVNQIEMHIFLQQQEVRDYCKKLGIQIEAYSPLAHAQIMNDPIIQQIAEKYNKTYSQIMLRWCLDNEAIPLPKSTTPSRIEENINIFDFKLDKDDLSKLATLNRDKKTLWRSIISS